MKDKSILVFTIMSISIWYLSTLLQAFTDLAVLNKSPNFFGEFCAGTGFPIALCIRPENKALVFLVSLSNIAIIFITLKMIRQLFKEDV
ncbi:MAG: hypothetical protein M3Q44_00930 [bacterium]|nr:hypothetical protein [bacterium]